MRTVFSILLTCSLLASSCSGEPADEVLLDGELRFDNMVDARAELGAAEARWAANEPAHYRWRVIADRPEPALEIEFVDGVVVASNVADHAWDVLPRSPDEAFEFVETLVAQIEADPDLEGDWETCSGRFFRFRFAPDTGAPTLWDDLDPCSDVIPVVFEVESLG